MELEALQRAYAADLEDRDAALALVGAEISRRFSNGDTDVWLERTLRDLADDLWQILDDADFDWYGERYEQGMFPLDSGEIWGATARNLLTFCDFDWGCDHFSIMDFGGGIAFEAFDSNPERGLDDYEIEGEIDLFDLGAIRELACDHLRMALSIGDHLGRCPDDIRFASPVTGDDIRSTTVSLFVSSVSTAEEYAEWMSMKGHGAWLYDTEENRAVLADAYLQVALGYPPTEHAVELSVDAGRGMLLSELMESDLTDLDRISNELDAVRDELPDRNVSGPAQTWAPMTVFNRLGSWQNLSGMDFGDPDGGFRWFSGRGNPLIGSVFRGARLDGVHLDQTDISLADFTGASMVRTGMGFVLAAYTSFRDADLTNADLWQLKAYRCDFRGAGLIGATLRGVSAVACRFEGADFTGVELGSADATRATAEAAAFCIRFGITIDRTGRRANDQAATGLYWNGPCDFMGSTGLPDYIADVDPTLR